MSENKRVTIKDVAKEAGYCAATVSLVLNGKANSVPQKTQKIIIETAHKMNYKPNYNARAMVIKKTDIIGIIIPDISNVFFSELVRHIQLEFAKYGYDIILCNSEEKAENDIKYMDFLSGRNIDGLLITPNAQSFKEGNIDKYCEALKKLDMPYLFLDRYIPELAPKVAVNNAESSYIAIKYLIEKGHRKIGIITGPLLLSSSKNRLKGVQRAFNEYDIEFSDKYVYEGNYDLESGKIGAEKLLETDISAIFTFSDIQAYGAIGSIKEKGKKIPDDISLLGFDDIFYSSLLDVPLTTMHQPVKELAITACNTLVNMIEKKDGANDVEEADVKLIAQLIERSSVKKIITD